MNQPNFYELHARDKAGLSDDWRVFRLECFPHRGDTIYVAVTGAICPAVFKTGPRKGQTQWSKRYDEQTVNLPVIEHDEFRKAWEQENDKCHECGGSGQQCAGWSVTDGTRYRHCTRCGATGKPPSVRDTTENHLATPIKPKQ